jgi:isopenicillin-N N-acyltransferase-like protein
VGGAKETDRGLVREPKLGKVNGMSRRYVVSLAVWLGWACVLFGQETLPPQALFSAALQRVAGLFDATNRMTFSATLEVVKADGLPSELAGQKVSLGMQAPDRIRAETQVKKETFVAGRLGQEVWIWQPGKQFGLIGAPGVARYATAPDRLDDTKLGPLALPIPREQLAMAPLLFRAESQPEEMIEGVRCQVVRATLAPEAQNLLKVGPMILTVAVRTTDGWPARIGYSDGKGTKAEVAVRSPRLEPTWAESRWRLAAPAGAKVERVALSHLMRFVPAAFQVLTTGAVELPVEKGREVVARHGKGRLERIDGTQVLFLEGNPEEMGEQHGTLLRGQVRDLVDRVLYGVGVGSSFEKGRWFFGEIEQCQARIGRFMDERYLREMDAIAVAARLDREEVRLANFFPELFHCSGFALMGSATAGGRIYHGRVLDYMKGVGLEPNAVVIVHRPDVGHAWANVGYAGFVGSVTAMNERHISIGEMGGRGEGNWDGKPMAQLVREVMEKASTLDEAVAIFRNSPRTCEYYYVISDGKSGRAVGIAATPERFELVEPGVAHEQLPHAVKDAVLLSAGDRYEELVKRVRGAHGRFDADSARELMTRPVCMKSNIHSVLFAPDTLDFWVANSDGDQPASHCRYTHYNLKELLKPVPAVTTEARRP